jgi:hypothetical protein
MHSLCQLPPWFYIYIGRKEAELLDLFLAADLTAAAAAKKYALLISRKNMYLQPRLIQFTNLQLAKGSRWQFIVSRYDCCWRLSEHN